MTETKIVDVAPSRAHTAAPAVNEAELSRRLALLSLEQKVRLLTGADFWALYAEPAVGLRRVVVSDGPAGVRGELWDERDPSANVPSPTALSASWDIDAVQRLGALLAAEARAKGVDVLLAPTVNLHRTPYGGRHFECLSEDPHLSGQIGAAYVRGVQSGGVGATVKHFVGNDSETERMSLDARIDERTLRELYLAPFDVIVREAGAWSVMAAYNRVDGVHMTENPLLREVLQDEWGFDGVTMSDWFANRTTEPSGQGALDLTMPGPDGPWGDALVAAVRAGDVPEDAVDDKVLRLLRLAARVGALEGFEPAVAGPQTYSDDDVAGLLRSSAAAGFVLASNDGVLPLDASALTTVAVLGPNAEVGRTLGGGSATVFPHYTVSPLDGIRTALPQGAVVYAPGVRASTRTSPARDALVRRSDSSPGTEVRFVAADGAVLGTEQRSGGTYNWMAGFGDEVVGDVARVEVHATLQALRAGTHEIGGSGLGRFALAVDGVEVFDKELVLPPGADLVEGLMAPPQHVHRLDLAAGEEVDVVLTHHIATSRDNGLFGDVGTMFQFNVEEPHGTDDDEIAQAVELARRSDVAIVVVGTTEEVESEGFDRDSLALPGRQDELVRRVAAANPRTVVVVNSGAPVLLPWAEEVGAVLLTWFPGQEFGNALADVLLGVVEPGGRLPTTWHSDEKGLPYTDPHDGVLTYDEGLFIGYRADGRAGSDPLYRFGHGLGYTTWEFSSVEVSPAAAGSAQVEVVVRNSGERAGRQVVQVYLGRSESSVERPTRWLAGFAAVTASPGEAVSVQIPLPSRAFEHWDVDASAWTVEPGDFRIEVGASSGDLPLVAELPAPVNA